MAFVHGNWVIGVLLLLNVVQLCSTPVFLFNCCCRVGRCGMGGLPFPSLLAQKGVLGFVNCVVHTAETNMVDAAGTTTYGYAIGGQLWTEDGPWSNDTVTNIWNSLQPHERR